MNQYDSPLPTELPVDRALRIDRVCREFEKAWEQNQQPQIENYLARLPEADRPPALKELIGLEFDYHRLHGLDFSISEYRERFPELSREWLSKLQDESTIQKSRQGSGDCEAERRTVRCPNCRLDITVTDSTAASVVCSGCGSAFEIRDIHETMIAPDRKRFGKFELLESVGSGSFGEVWKARDRELQRIVALKIPHSNLLSLPEFRERFDREARAAAQLRHPGIVALYEICEIDRTPVLVTQFVDGVPLRDYLQTQTLSYRQIAELISQIASALHYAHSRGLVHRDIKPANIMVEFSSGPPSSVKPLLVDFGLALRNEAEIAMTMEGQILGTPAYMSPEQATGQLDVVDARSDVYSLGVVLYELLTGVLPFRGSKGMLLQQLRFEDPRTPRKINDRIPRDLETVCLKCMEKSAAKRYSTAAGLAEDLQRWLNGEPIRARPAGLVERTIKWSRRRPAAASLMVLVVLVSFVGFPLALWLWQRAESALSDLQKARVAQTQQLYYQLIDLANKEQKAFNLGRAEDLLEQTPSHLRGWEFHYLKRARFNPVWQLPDVTRWSFQFSRDGRTMAVMGDNDLSVWDLDLRRPIWTRPASQIRWWLLAPGGDYLCVIDEDRSVALWELAGNRPIVQTTTFAGAHDWEAGVCDFSSDGSLWAVAEEDSAIRTMETLTEKTVSRVLVDHEVVLLRLLEHGKSVATVSSRGKLSYLDAQSGQVHYSLYLGGDKTPVDLRNLSLQYSLSGERLIVTDESNSVRVIDVRSGKTLLQVPPSVAPTESVTVSEDDSLLAIGDYNGTAQVWDIRRRTRLITVEGHMAPVNALTMTADGSRLATGSAAGKIKLWDAGTGQEILDLQTRGRSLYSMAFSPATGWCLAAHSSQGGIEVWDATPTSDRPISDSIKLDVHEQAIRSVAWTPDGTQIISAAEDSTLRSLNAVTRQPGLQIKAHEMVIRQMALSPDGSKAATASLDGYCRVWSIPEGELIWERYWSGGVYSCEFDSQGKTLAIGIGGGDVELYHVDDFSHRGTLSTSGASPWALAFHPDRPWLFQARTSGQILIWDLTVDQHTEMEKVHLNSIFDLDVSEDGRWLVSGGYDGKTIVWDVESGTAELTLTSEADIVFSVTISPDSRWILAGGRDGKVRVWDREQGGELSNVLGGHLGIVWDLKFNPAAPQLAVSGGYRGHGEIRIWDLSNRDSLATTDD